LEKAQVLELVLVLALLVPLSLCLYQALVIRRLEILLSATESVLAELLDQQLARQKAQQWDLE
jgi:hypothetical protein